MDVDVDEVKHKPDDDDGKLCETAAPAADLSMRNFLISSLDDDDDDTASVAADGHCFVVDAAHFKIVACSPLISIAFTLRAGRR